MLVGSANLCLLLQQQLLLLLSKGGRREASAAAVDHGTEADTGQSPSPAWASFFRYAGLEVETDTWKSADDGDGRLPNRL